MLFYVAVALAVFVRNEASETGCGETQIGAVSTFGRLVHIGQPVGAGPKVFENLSGPFEFAGGQLVLLNSADSVESCLPLVRRCVSSYLPIPALPFLEFDDESSSQITPQFFRAGRSDDRCSHCLGFRQSG
jgi:hypothetical protein